MKNEFNALWEQCIESQTNAVRYWLKENDKEMIKLHRDILKRMKEQYEQVKLKT